MATQSLSYSSHLSKQSVTMCSLTVDPDTSSRSARVATFVGSTSAFILKGSDAQALFCPCICIQNRFQEG